MSRENVKKFYEALANDKAMQKKLETAGKKLIGLRDSIYQNDLIPLAKSAGFDFTLSELKEYAASIPGKNKSALSDEELAAVTGGLFIPTINP